MVDLIYYVIFTDFTSLHAILFQLMTLINTFSPLYIVNGFLLFPFPYLNLNTLFELF